MSAHIPEEFICYLWKFKLLKLPLLSIDNKEITVEKTGIRNTDGGPDFSNALIKFEETVWAGNIEIHNKSSEWIKHNHHKDRKYENVILHVVLNNDLGDGYKNFRPVATTEIINNFDFKMYAKYQGFMKNQGWIACENSIHSINHITKTHFLQRLAIERIERRFNHLSEELAIIKSDIERLFYIELFKSFGFKTNRNPFELLIKSIPQLVISKHKFNLTQIESLLFGQAGLLEKDMPDDYYQQLKSEYKFLKHKYSLKPISGHLWQYLRLRPTNFPNIRIAQLAMLLHQNNDLFSKIINCKKLIDLIDLFKVSASSYWINHYKFDKKSVSQIKKIGLKTTESIIINCIIPIFYIYGHRTMKEEYRVRAISFLEELKGERNAIINRWKEFGLPTENALQTQALLELKSQYCDLKRCLECEFGCELLNKN